MLAVALQQSLALKSPSAALQQALLGALPWGLQPQVQLALALQGLEGLVVALARVVRRAAAAQAPVRL